MYLKILIIQLFEKKHNIGEKRAQPDYKRKANYRNRTLDKLNLHKTVGIQIHSCTQN